MKIVLDENAVMPSRSHEWDAGLDLYSRESRYVSPGEHVVFDTGVHVEIPKGYVGLITSKSGLMAKGITSRGTIDSGYTGSIRAVLFNHGERGYLVQKGDKITQMVVLPVLIEGVELTDTLEETDRGAGGFGSTGR